MSPLLDPPDSELFFSRHDPGDPRMGDVVVRVSNRIDVEEILERMDALGVHPRVAIIGVPQDAGVERNGGRVGAAEAPRAIRQWLYRLTTFDIETSNVIPHGFVIDVGDIDCDGELEAVHARLSETVSSVCAAGVVPVVLGGGHDITYATVSGAARKHGPMGAINIDAHLDVRTPSPLRNSGTPFRMLIEEGSLVPECFIEFGIQGFANAASHAQWLLGRGGKIITLDDVRARGCAKAFSTAWQSATAGVNIVYGSLDIDAVRASEAPGVSASMPDGFTTEEVLFVARQLGRRTATAGLDVVEVNPTYDRDGITSKLAAHAVARFISGVSAR